MILRRLRSLVAELEASDPSGQLLGLVLGQLAGLRAPLPELQRLTVDPDVRAAVLALLEGLQAIREAEREAEEDARYALAQGERVQ